MKAELAGGGAPEGDRGIGGQADGAVRQPGAHELPGGAAGLGEGQMIIRIMGEGQLKVDDAAVDELNQLDVDLEAAVEQDDETAFGAALHALLAKARAVGAAAAARRHRAVGPDPAARGRDDRRSSRAADRRRADPRLRLSLRPS